MRRTPALPVVLAWLASGAVASAEPSIGLAVGEKAPPFELVDQNGEKHSFESLLGRGKLAIVFYRSADW